MYGALPYTLNVDILPHKVCYCFQVCRDSPPLLQKTLTYSMQIFQTLPLPVFSPPLSPGDKLCSVEDCIPGTGVYLRHGYIYSSLAGYVLRKNEGEEVRSVVGRREVGKAAETIGHVGVPEQRCCAMFPMSLNCSRFVQRL